MFHESLTTTTDMTILSCVLERRALRRTNLGTPLSQRPAAARWHVHLRGLVTAIHETSGLTLEF
jgi:hypothetical protein